VGKEEIKNEGVGPREGPLPIAQALATRKKEGTKKSGQKKKKEKTSQVSAEKLRLKMEEEFQNGQRNK